MSEPRSASGIPAKKFWAITEKLYEPMRKVAHGFVVPSGRIRPEDAEDFVQRAFEKAWESRYAPGDEDGLRRWLPAVIRHQAEDRWRAESSYRNLRPAPSMSALDTDENAFPAVASPEDSVVNRIIVEQLLAGLPENEQKVLLMLADGFNTSAIAERLGITHSEAMRLLSRAKYRARQRAKYRARHYELAHETDGEVAGSALDHLKRAADPHTDPRTLQRVADVLERLPAEDRRWLEYWYLDAMKAYGSFASVATRMGVTETDGRTALRRARLRFARLWERSS
ncbi:MAG: RNA polymerase sigma factor [Acidimicrobiales bacterium]